MIKGSRPRPYPPTPQQFKIQPKGDKAHTRESNTDPQPLRSGSWYSFWSAFSVDAVVGTHKPEAKENPQTGYKPCDLQQVIHPRFQCGKEKNTRLTTSAASTTWGNVYETEHFLAKTTWKEHLFHGTLSHSSLPTMSRAICHPKLKGKLSLAI